MFCYGFGLCVGCLVWVHVFIPLDGFFMALGLGSPEFAGEKGLANFSFETFGWVGVLGFD